MSKYKLFDIPVGKKMPVNLVTTRIGNITVVNHKLELHHLKTDMFEDIFVEDLLVNIMQFYIKNRTLIGLNIIFDEYEVKPIITKIFHNFPNAVVLEDSSEKLSLKNGDLHIEIHKKYKSGHQVFLSNFSKI